MLHIKDYASMLIRYFIKTSYTWEGTTNYETFNNDEFVNYYCMSACYQMKQSEHFSS